VSQDMSYADMPTWGAVVITEILGGIHGLLFLSGLESLLHIMFFSARFLNSDAYRQIS
jgi:hypothetical protein